MNIAFYKLGKVSKFTMKIFNPIGGDAEPRAFLIAMAYHNPQNTYYIVSRSEFGKLNDFEKKLIFPYNNVVDCLEGFRGNLDDETILKYAVNFLKERNINIDAIVGLTGPVGGVSVMNRVPKLNEPDKFYKPLDMFKLYASSTIYFLNEFKDVPHIEINLDTRYSSKLSRDMWNNPDVSLGLGNYSYDRKYVTEYYSTDYTKSTIDCKYDGIENNYLVCRTRKDNAEKKRKTKFIIVLNGDNDAETRYVCLKEWVLDNPQFKESVEIYGNWHEKYINGDKRFKGCLDLYELTDYLENVKYTMLFSIKQSRATQKYLEIIFAGCIPFLHPLYDHQKNVDFPEILRPQTPEDLEKAIEFFENNDDERIKMVKFLQDKFLSEYALSGKMTSDMINKHLENLGLKQKEYTGEREKLKFRVEKGFNPMNYEFDPLF